MYTGRVALKYSTLGGTADKVQVGRSRHAEAALLRITRAALRVLPSAALCPPSFQTLHPNSGPVLAWWERLVARRRVCATARCGRQLGHGAQDVSVPPIMVSNGRRSVVDLSAALAEEERGRTGLGVHSTHGSRAAQPLIYLLATEDAPRIPRRWAGRGDRLRERPSLSTHSNRALPLAL